MYGYEDITSAHDALDTKLGITDVKLVLSEDKDPVRELVTSYGYDPDAIRKVGEDYARGAVLFGLPLILSDGADPLSATMSMCMSAFFQGFMCALFMIHEYTGQKAA